MSSELNYSEIKLFLILLRNPWRPLKDPREGLDPTLKTTGLEQTGASLEFVVPKDVADGFVNNKRESYKFRFQKVFDQAANQEEIFETIAKPVADSVLAGYNGTIFAYGQTGSGKTFTITGGAEHYSDRGIIPRTLSYLYQRFSQDSSMLYTTHISYLEIYNEVGYDLLDTRHEASRLEDLPKVVIMEDPDQNIHLRNLSLQQSANEEEALNLLFLGDTNRMIAETPMNQASTRSHCIFTVHLCGREPGSATLRRSKLHLVDLAGSERVGKTGVGGQLLTEAKYINLSLHYLEQVIIALSEKNRSHIPYRNSMMTSVLRDSLGGNCMTTMIATVSVDRMNLGVRMSNQRPCSDKMQKAKRNRTMELKNVSTVHMHSHETSNGSILVSMLKKEKKRAQDAAAQLANITSDHRLASQAQHMSHCRIWFLSGLQLSVGKQEAFEIFRRDHEDQLTIEDNKALLKQRKRNEEHYLKQICAFMSVSIPTKIPYVFICVWKTCAVSFACFHSTLGVTGNYTEAEGEADPVEENLRKQIEEEKKTYKSTFGCLKVLRTEIEHLQLLLERAKVKLQKDFQDWWSQEASNLQATAGRQTGQTTQNLQPSSPGVRGFRALSTTQLSSSAIPLTGDQQTDADILAFIRARQSLLNRTGLRVLTKHSAPSQRHHHQSLSMSLSLLLTFILSAASLPCIP
uniref:Kinesin-like protein n=1 Tax=Myripristis murdjan TaxID=586833 RepID=A0A667XS17_9TELE